MHRKPIIILSISIFLSITFAAIGVGVAASDDNVVKTFGDYHIKVNLIVDQKINGVYDFFDEFDSSKPESLADLQAVLLPPNTMTKEACDENLSSSCLTFLLNTEYQLVATSVLGDLNNLDNAQPEAGLLNVGSGSDQKNQFIMTELQNARNATENTVEFYRQFLFAYPLHLELESTTQNLKDLMGEIRKFANKLEEYPSKFHDATTVQCQ